MASKPIMSWSAGLLVALSTFSAAFALVLVAVKVAEEEAEASLVPVADLFVSGPPAFSTTQFFSGEARIEDWRAGNCDVGRPVLDGARIEEFLRPLEGCAQGGQKVEVRVSGYASSSLAGGMVRDFDLQCDDCPKLWKRCLEAQKCERSASEGARRVCVGKAFNLCVANERGRLAAVVVRERMAGSEHWLEVISREWPKYELMAKNRSVEDRRDGRYDPVRGVVNLQARLEVVGTGRCLVAATREKGVDSTWGAWANRELHCLNCLLRLETEPPVDCGEIPPGPGICPTVEGWMVALRDGVPSLTGGDSDGESRAGFPVEGKLKKLDGCSVAGKYSVFGSAATDLDWSVLVTDNATRVTLPYRRNSRNPLVADVAALPCHP